MHDDTLTNAQHDAADAAMIANMTRRIFTTEWGAEIIDAAIDECGYSPWIRNVAGNNPAVILADDPDADRARYYVATRHDIARAIAEIWNGKHGNGYIREYIADAILHHDAGNIDADAADAIVQVAMYGEIVYG